MPTVVTVNRAPVLTLRAAIVAERLGVAWGEALTLGRAVAGLSDQLHLNARALRLPHPAGGTLLVEAEPLHMRQTFRVLGFHPPAAQPPSRTSGGS